MGASTGNSSDPRARQMAAEGIRQRRRAIESAAPGQPGPVPQQIPGLASEEVSNPSLGVPGGAPAGIDLFQRVLAQRGRVGDRASARNMR